MTAAAKMLKTILGKWGECVMTKAQKSREIKRSDITPIKSRLIEVLSRIERDGLKRDADQLGNIIARLEDWQNR